MAWLKTIATVQDIADVVAHIVERFHPQQVVLFGSYAYGAPTPDSDVDLLVVMETLLRNVEQAVEIRKAIDCPFPVDLLVRTPQHIAERIALGDVFLREVLTKGVVLYATKGVRQPQGSQE
jgi:predicted nucleotidyltransferase